MTDVMFVSELSPEKGSTSHTSLILGGNAGKGYFSQATEKGRNFTS